jgi:hypothetical protein
LVAVCGRLNRQRPHPPGLDRRAALVLLDPLRQLRAASVVKSHDLRHKLDVELPHQQAKRLAALPLHFDQPHPRSVLGLNQPAKDTPIDQLNLVHRPIAA